MLKTTNTRDTEEIVKKPNGINYTDDERALLHPRVRRMNQAVSEMEICKAPSPATPPHGLAAIHMENEAQCHSTQPQRGQGPPKTS